MFIFRFPDRPNSVSSEENDANKIWKRSISKIQLTIPTTESEPTENHTLFIPPKEAKDDQGFINPSHNKDSIFYQQQFVNSVKTNRLSGSSAISARTRGEAVSSDMVSKLDFRTSRPKTNQVEEDVSTFDSTKSFDNTSDFSVSSADTGNNATDLLILPYSEGPIFSEVGMVDTGLPRSRGARNIEDAKGSVSENTLISSSPENDVRTLASPVISQARVTGLQVESHAKGIAYEDGTALLQADYDAEIRVFGVGLTEDVSIQFTAHNDTFGGRCDSSTSEVFQVRVFIIQIDMAAF